LKNNQIVLNNGLFSDIIGIRNCLDGDLVKKLLIILIIILTILNTYTYALASENLYINADAALLMDYDTKEILYNKNMNKKLYPASTTKIMTGILALEKGNLNDIVTIDQEIVDLTGGSHIALEPGEKLSLEQLMYAMLLPSANDAALAISKHIGGSVDEFISMMNEKAKEIGATNTNYVNPNGLHNANHYSTAHDLALIGRYAMEIPEFRKFVNTTTYTIEPTNIKTEARYLKVTNKLLFSGELINLGGKYVPAKYEGASGVKTGYTPQAGNCLVSYAQKDGQKMLAVILNAEGLNVYSDTHTLLNYGFDHYSNTVLCYKNEFVDNFKITKGKLPFVAGVIESNLVYPVINNSTSNIDKKISIREDLTAPIQKNDVIGTVEYLSDGKPIGNANIVSTMDVEVDPNANIVYRILSKWYILLLFLFIGVRINNLNKRKKRRQKRRTYSIEYMK